MRLIKPSEAIKYLYTNMCWYNEDGEMADDEEKDRAITDLVNGIPTVPAIPMERIKQLRGDTDNKLQIAKAYTMNLPYIRGVYDTLELIDNMIKEYSE